jgi:hypothetical protein
VATSLCQSAGRYPPPHGIDAHFFDALLDDMEADPQRIGIAYLNGKDALEANLDSLVKTSAFVQKQMRKLAIVWDADASGAVSLKAVQSALQARGFPSPDHGLIPS